MRCVCALLLIPACASVTYTPQAYEYGLKKLHGAPIALVLQKMPTPTRTYFVPWSVSDRQVQAYDWAFWANDWIGPWITSGYGGVPIYEFHGRHCLTTLYVDREEQRVVGHKFEGSDCLAPESDGPKEIWVLMKTESVAK